MMYLWPDYVICLDLLHTVAHALRIILVSNMCRFLLKSLLWCTPLGQPICRTPTHAHHSAATTRLIGWAWDLVLQLWQQRNQKPFTKSDINMATTSALCLQVQVHELYSCSKHLPHSNLDAYFHEDLEQFQLQPLHVLEAWITQVDRVYIWHHKEIQQWHICNTITHYFRHTMPHNFGLNEHKKLNFSTEVPTRTTILAST